MPIYALGDAIAHVHPRAFVHPQATLIGEVHVGSGASIWPGVVIRADNGPIVIGARTSIQDGSVLHTQHLLPTVIGAGCVVGHLAHLEGCVLEDHVLVGSGAVVLEGAVLRAVSFVAAAALVRPHTEVPSGAMAIGVPATLREGVVTLDMIEGNARAYELHIVQHRDGMRAVEPASCITEDVRAP